MNKNALIVILLVLGIPIIFLPKTNIDIVYHNWILWAYLMLCSFIAAVTTYKDNKKHSKKVAMMIPIPGILYFLFLIFH